MSDHKDCNVEPVEKRLDKNALINAEAAFLSITGMGCPRCAMRVRNGLLTQNGVLYADISLENGMAVVAFDATKVPSDKLVSFVADAGNDGRHHYGARVLEVMPASEVFMFAN